MRNHVILFILLLIAQPLIAQVPHTISIQTSIAATLPTMGVAGPITGVLQNHLIVAGGANFPNGMPWKGGSKTYHNQIFIYQQTEKKENQQHTSYPTKDGHTETQFALQLIAKDQQLPEPLAYAALCNTEEGLVVIGGENTNGISSKTWLLKWEAANKKIAYQSYPALPVPLTNASAICVNNRIYLMGGETATTTSDAIYVLEIENLRKGWQPLGSMPKPLSHMVLTSITKDETSSLYVMGGRQKQTSGISLFSQSVYRYSIEKNTWETLANMPYALSAGTGVWWNNDQIVLFGGDRGIVFNQVEKLLVAIANETDPAKKQELIQQKNLLQESHPGFSREILLYASDSNQWKTIGTLTPETPVTTTAFIWNSSIYIPSGEIKAGVRTPHILQIKLYPPQP